MLEFLHIPIDDTRFAETLKFTAFDNLKRLENEHGFKEARGSTGKFFNVGRSGNGREVLSQDQIDRIIKHHAPTMRLLGYA